MRVTTNSHGINDVNVGCGLRFLSPVTVTVDPEDPSGNIEKIVLEVDYDKKLKRFATTSVSVVRNSEGTEITGTELRSVRVKDFLRDGLLEIFSWTYNPDLPHNQLELFDKERLRETKKSGSSPETLEAVAKLYRFAQVLNEKPAKFVKDMLDIPQATATDWIARAKRGGFFTPGE